MAAIIDQLRREHQIITALLAVLDRQATVLEQAGEPDLDALEALAEYFSDYPELVHHPKEDLVWRALERRDAAAAAPVGDLEGEHRRLGALTRTFAEAIHAMLHDAEVRRDAATHVIRRFVDAERKHMAMEEQQFFPVALETLKAEDWEAVDAQADRRRDPLGADAADQRFASLRRVIADAT